MDRSPILFRCDGNNRAGWEATYQCLTYAAALQRRRRVSHFLSQIEPFPLIAQVARGGNEYIAAAHPAGSPEDCDETIRIIRKLGVAAVVVAVPGVTTDYLRELSSTGVLVAVIDSEAAVRFPTKLVFNPLLGLEARRYEHERGTQLCLGERYALVRSVFRRQRSLRPLDPQGPYRALIALGDDDFCGQTLIRTRELLAASRVEKITVMVRSHHHEYDDLKALAEEHKARLEVLTETSELSTRLPRAHFAITSGDGWSLEMACVGIPQFVMTHDRRHIACATRLEQEGAGLYLGAADGVSELNLREAINHLLDDQLERVGMARCARYLVDGRGPDRMVNAIEVMLHPAILAGQLRIAA